MEGVQQVVVGADVGSHGGDTLGEMAPQLFGSLDEGLLDRKGLGEALRRALDGVAAVELAARTTRRASSQES